MSEQRKPDEVYLKRVNRDDFVGRTKAFGMKIEAFLAWHWAMNWTPSSVLFWPKPPLKNDDRRDFWRSMYRVRIDGKWFGKNTKYTLLTRDQFIDLLGKASPEYMSTHTWEGDDGGDD